MAFVHRQALVCKVTKHVFLRLFARTNTIFSAYVQTFLIFLLPNRKNT